MTSIARRVIGGVDTHKDVHVAAALDEVGRLLATASFPTTRHGYCHLLRWLRSHGEVMVVGAEGCGSWGPAWPASSLLAKSRSWRGVGERPRGVLQAGLGQRRPALAGT